MRRFLLSIILICVLILPVSAHPGDTDSSGGHYDHEAGEYHYHHGYPAHDHYDMDGDGDADCPYDFDDQTGANSGASSRSPSSTGTTDTTYAYTAKDVTTARNAGYTMGYEEGLTEGRESGYTDGYRKGQAEGSSSAKTAALWIGGLAGTLLLFLSYRRGKRHQEEIERLTVDFQKKLDRLKAEHEASLAEKDRLIAEHDAAIQQIDYSHELKLQKVIQQTKLLTRLHANIPAAKKQLGIPLDITFDGDNISMGARSADYPYGKLTVFTTYSGTRYHFVRGCSGCDTPNFLFNIVERKAPCQKCSNDRNMPDYVPEWYTEYKRLLANQHRIEANHSAPPKQSPVHHERLNDLPEKWGKPITPPPQSKLRKPGTITEAELTESALRYGINIPTALLMLNQERERNGLPPLVLDEDR